MATGVPLGTRISLITKSEVRYEGIFSAIGTTESYVVLDFVRCYGTEDRPTDRLVAPTDKIDRCLVFWEPDIKTILHSDGTQLEVYAGQLRQTGKPIGSSSGKPHPAHEEFEFNQQNEIDRMEMKHEIDESYQQIFQSTIENYEGDLKQLSDFKIKCGIDKIKIFNCHKIPLVTKSRVFKAMICHDMKESRNNEVLITDVAPDTMEKMLQYIYTGKIEEGSLTHDLFIASDKYEIKELKMECEQHFFKNLSTTNAVDTLILASSYGTENFDKHVARFVSNNWGTIKTSDTIEDLKNYPDIQLKIMKLLS